MALYLLGMPQAGHLDAIAAVHYMGPRRSCSQVRAKYMTLDPEANRYVKHFRQIRVIQDYLVRRADRHCIPRVDNTNVDRSVAAIHATVLSCLRRQARVGALS